MTVFDASANPMKWGSSAILQTRGDARHGEVARTEPQETLRPGQTVKLSPRWPFGWNNHPRCQPETYLFPKRFSMVRVSEFIAYIICGPKKSPACKVLSFIKITCLFHGVHSNLTLLDISVFSSICGLGTSGSHTVAYYPQGQPDPLSSYKASRCLF